jgi:hypothetical protein
VRSTIALAAALAFALSSTLALAGGKKEAPDPRKNLITLPGKSQTWCSINPDCNGWTAWLAQKSKPKKG